MSRNLDRFAQFCKKAIYFGGKKRDPWLDSFIVSKCARAHLQRKRKQSHLDWIDIMCAYCNIVNFATKMQKRRKETNKKQYLCIVCDIL